MGQLRGMEVGHVLEHAESGAGVAGTDSGAHGFTSNRGLTAELPVDT